MANTRAEKNQGTCQCDSLTLSISTLVTLLYTNICTGILPLAYLPSKSQFVLSKFTCNNLLVRILFLLS